MARAKQTKKDTGVKKAKSGLPSGGLLSIVQNQIDSAKPLGKKKSVDGATPLLKKKSSASASPLLKKKSSASASPLLKKKSSTPRNASPATLSKKMSTTSVDDESNAQVDSHVWNKDIYEVVYDAENKISHSVYLMKTEIKANNNKFYVVQVLHRKGTE